MMIAIMEVMLMIIVMVIDSDVNDGDDTVNDIVMMISLMVACYCVNASQCTTGDCHEVDGLLLPVNKVYHRNHHHISTDPIIITSLGYLQSTQ